jgi:hypothetical protein
LCSLQHFFLESSPAPATAAVIEVSFTALEPSVVASSEVSLGAIIIDNAGQRVTGKMAIEGGDDAWIEPTEVVPRVKDKDPGLTLGDLVKAMDNSCLG